MRIDIIGGELSTSIIYLTFPSSNTGIEKVSKNDTVLEHLPTLKRGTDRCYLLCYSWDFPPPSSHDISQSLRITRLLNHIKKGYKI